MSHILKHLQKQAKTYASTATTEKCERISPVIRAYHARGSMRITPEIRAYHGRDTLALYAYKRSRNVFLCFKHTFARLNGYLTMLFKGVVFIY